MGEVETFDTVAGHGPPARPGRRAALRVLLIDDDPEDQVVVRELVTAGGDITCDVARSFEEGAELVQGDDYDAYLVGLGLGGESGAELIKELAASASGPMVLLTGAQSETADAVGLEAGAADYLVKAGLTSEVVGRSIRYSVEMWRARRNAEEGYRKYLSLFDGVPVGLFRIHPDGTFIEVNQAAVEMLGYESKSELMGKSGRDILAATQPRDVPLLTGGATVGELEMVTRDGERCWVDVTLREVRNASGALIHYEGVAVDITERKRAEVGVLVRERLLDQVPSAVIVTDMEGVCLLWNKHAESMYGWTAEEAIGKPIFELTVPADDAESSAEIVASIARTGRWEGEFTARRRDGSIFEAQVSNSLLYDDRGEAIGIVGVSLDLTDTRAAAAELRHYQELVTAAYDNSSVSKAIVAVPEGTIVSANPALGDFLGYDVDGLIGKHIGDVTHPEDIDLDLEQFQQVASGDIDGYTIDKRYIRSDGEIVWGRLQASSIRDEHGPKYAVGQVVDITERKRAEDHIAFQASLFRQMRTPVIATDLRGTVTHWNQQAEETYGWTREEAIGQNFLGLVVPDMSSEEFETMQAEVREHGIWEGQLMVTRKHGEQFPAWASGAVIRDGSGRPAGMVGALTDLTDVEAAQAQAEAQEMLSRSLLEAVSVPIAVVDRDGNVVVSNPSWEISKGEPTHPYLPGCIPGDPDPEVLQEIVSGVDTVLLGARDHFTHEYSCQVGGEERWMRIVVMRSEADGGAIVSHWDITNDRFARAALEEIIKSKDEFIASVSHEIRTPLSVVVGLAETLREGGSPQADMKEFHELIADQAQEMALIVEDLLVAGRLDTDTLTVRSQMISLEDEIDTVIRPWQNKDDVELSVRLRPGSEKAYADSLRVRQIVRNLLTNAIRYGKQPVEIKAVRARDNVIVAVSDHGSGVPAEALEKMFQAYARFGAIEGQPSSVGLGLHVARRLARLMGGDLVYKQGAALTTFLLTLPAQSPDGLERSGDGKRFLMG